MLPAILCFNSGIDADMSFHFTSIKFRVLFVFALILISLSGLKADNDTMYNTIAGLRALKGAQTPTDSIRILLDVYNLSDKINRDKLRVQIIDLTQRSDSQDVIDNVLRELSTSTDDTEELARLLEISSSLPDSAGRTSIQTVLEMEQAESQATNAVDSQLKDQVVLYTHQGLLVGSDPYKEIQNIYRAMTFLGLSSQGPLYLEYIKRLEELVNALPASDHSIKNLFYTTAALFYTRKRDYEKAINFDRLLIKQLDDMNAYYKSIGDTSHDLDNFYYTSYRRMLRNFKGLTPEEVEEIYQKCLELAKKNPKIGETFGKKGLSNSYYYMAKEEYSKAIPEIKKALSNDDISKYRRRELLGHLAYAQKETGDSKGELQTLRDYTRMLLDDRDERLEDMYKEVELRNSVVKIINDESRVQERQRQENSEMRKTSITLVYVLAIILIFMAASYIRLYNRVKELNLKNKKLHRNIEDIFDDGVPKGSTNLHIKIHKLKG